MTAILLPHHTRELFKESGIAPAVAQARGYRSVTASDVAQLGFAHWQCRDGLLMPQWTLAGVQREHLLKPNNPRTDEKGKVLKYEARHESVPHFDIHPDARYLLGDPSVTLYFTEGNKKSDAAWSRGLPCVSLPGVWQFIRDKRVVPDLDEIALKDRLVRVVYDSDVTRKPSVAEALYRLSDALHRRGATVEIVYLPEGPDGEKVGLDDWFVAGHTVAELDALARHFEDCVDFEQSWTPPVPLPEGERPAFPVELLPGPLSRWVDGLSVATQTPPALAGMLSTTAIAAAAAKRVLVQIRDGWTEPVNTYFLVAIGSGNRKSAVEAAVSKPLRTYERENAEAMRIEAAQARARRTAAEKRLDRMLREQADEVADNPDLAVFIEELVLKLAEDPQLQIPTALRLLVDDVTPERLAALMAEHDGRMGVISAEGGIFQTISGRYSDRRADALDLFLKGHSGDDLPIDRVGRETKQLTAPALTLGLAVQPEVLAGLAAQPGFRGRGLLARFGYGCPVSTVGRRQVAPRPVAPETSAEYDALVRSVLTLSGEPKLLTLSTAAQRTFIAFEEALEPRLGPDGDLEHVADWGAKLAGLVARLAALFHVVENVVQSQGTSYLQTLEIPSQTVQNAIALAETFLIPHAKTAFAAMGADPALDDARRVLRVIRPWPEDTISRRDLHQHLRSTFPKPDDLNRPLALLVEHGWLRHVEAQAKGVGRKPSPLFEINPLRHAQNTHNPQNSPTNGHFEDSVYFEDGYRSSNGHAPVDPVLAGQHPQVSPGEWF